MNPRAAKVLDWTSADLKDYYGLGKNSVSLYRRRKDFSPGAGTLAIAAPKQLHETETHPGFVPVKMEGGVYAQRKDVVAMLDGVPFKLMHQAYEHLRDVDLEAWITVEAVSYRTRHQTIENVASKLSLTRSAIYKRIERAMETISDFLNREMDRAVAS